MPPQRRNDTWFYFFLVLMLVGGYGVITAAVAGSQKECGNGSASIAWVWQPVPRFECVSRSRF